MVSGLSWTANGGDMSLVLADAEGNPIDMSGLREIAKNHVNAFTVTMRAALTMTEPACQAGIVASQNSRRLRNPSWASTSMTSSPLTARSLWWVPTT